MDFVRPAYSVERKRTGKGLKLIFSHHQEIEARAIEAVRNEMRNNQVELPGIPAISEAHFKTNCAQCDNAYWRTRTGRNFCSDACFKEYMQS